jgi:poly(A)-specific ribonuclease
VHGTPDKDNTQKLSRFETRLVHQLVRAEFLDLSTRPSFGNVLVENLDERREAAFLASKKEKVQKEIISLTGFRWLIEAMTGSDLAALDDISQFAHDPDTGAAIYFDHQHLKAKWDRVSVRLRNRPTVLVGHNLFTDLIYLFRAFIGPLPDTVQEHAKNIHALFPRVVDTKFLATYDAGRIQVSSSLQDLNEGYLDQQCPKVEVHPEHQKYAFEATYHEAGYDSLCTARLLICISGCMIAEGKFSRAENAPSPKTQSSSNESSYHTALSSQSPEKQETKADKKKREKKEKKQREKKARKKAKKEAERQEAAEAAALPHRFSNANPYDALRGQSTGPSVSRASSSVVSPSWDAPSPTPQDHRMTFLPAKPCAAPCIKASTRVPSFDGAFWGALGNKLRVFGTVEEVCDLGNWVGE